MNHEPISLQQQCADTTSTCGVHLKGVPASSLLVPRIDGNPELENQGLTLCELWKIFCLDVTGRADAEGLNVHHQF